ncbi:MAG TPA: hypothetical protein VN721_06765 [Flavipsychrobacter sp.]|nr:hypothetical protein [Flavipsychrobacter sp.]
MKKIAVLFLVVFCILGCKKKYNAVSQVVRVSTPTVTLTGSLYYSIPVGGSLPTISATAYDSVYKQSLPVTIDKSTLDNSTPGLYIVQIVATNQYGYKGSANVYVGVTNVPAAENLAGQYLRGATGAIVNVSKLATGMYLTDNFGGVDTTASPGFNFSAVFVQTSDTTIDFGASGQPTADGTLIVTDASLTTVPGDTSFSYKVTASGFGTSLRTFVKQ